LSRTDVLIDIAVNSYFGSGQSFALMLDDQEIRPCSPPLPHSQDQHRQPYPDLTAEDPLPDDLRRALAIIHQDAH
jgi:hypothetical protein